MGIYLNPPGVSKETWLAAWATEEVFEPPSAHKRQGELEIEVVVCLISNSAFSAAAVAYSREELQAFRSPLDRRPKRWFWVPAHALNLATCGVDVEAIIKEYESAGE